MRITYDREADAAYIYVVDKIGKGEAKKTFSLDTKKIKATISCDFDKDGMLLGIEILPAGNILRKEVLKKTLDITNKAPKGAK